MNAAKIILLLGGLFILCISALIYAPDVKRIQGAAQGYRPNLDLLKGIDK